MCCCMLYRGRYCCILREVTYQFSVFEVVLHVVRHVLYRGRHCCIEGGIVV